MNKRILITGGSGFIGHHIVSYVLDRTDWDIVIMDRLDISGNLNRLVDLPNWNNKRVNFVWHDLKSSINQYVARDVGKINYILHLAASTHVDRSMIDPMSFVLDNVVGTTNLLEYARTLDSLEKFINFSTDEVFGPAKEGHSHKENDPHFPSNPYSASKSGQEAIGYAFFVSFGLPIITTHTVNNFGERQHPEKLVPKAIRNIIRGDPVPVFAELDGEKLVAVGSRYWIHCQNTASAVLFLLKDSNSGEAYNIIGFDELTNEDIVHKVGEFLGKDPKIQFVDFHKVRPGHDRRYALDGRKLESMGWRPEISFDESLKKVVEFTRDNPRWQ